MENANEEWLLRTQVYIYNRTSSGWADTWILLYFYN